MFDVPKEDTHSNTTTQTKVAGKFDKVSLCICESLMKPEVCFCNCSTVLTACYDRNIYFY